MSDPVPVESWVVVRTEPCPGATPGKASAVICEAHNAEGIGCGAACLGDGRRAVLDTAQEVEPAGIGTFPDPDCPGHRDDGRWYPPNPYRHWLPAPVWRGAPAPDEYTAVCPDHPPVVRQEAQKGADK